ncbi:putative immunity protein [Stappia sp.]|uniref:putative immunity protein n=1 Tax=Stappia sp. TaxID=1870903 RepID=UPI003D0C8281
MTRDTRIELGLEELRAVTAYAVACARLVLPVFEACRPADMRPSAAVEAGRAFADGARRSRVLRECAWAALRSAREAADAGEIAAGQVARAAAAAAGAAYLHPLADATQVKHILGSAAHAARAIELSGEGEADGHLATLRDLATPLVASVLRRYPAAPPGGGRVGELMRELDRTVRGPGVTEDPSR